MQHLGMPEVHSVRIGKYLEIEVDDKTPNLESRLNDLCRDLLVDDFVRSFYLKPSRVLNRVHSSRQLLNSLWQGNFLQFGTKRILLVDHDLEIESCSSKISIDVLVISKTPKLHLLQLSKTFNIRQVVFDGSVSPRKIKYWINDCALLRIPYHNVNEKGAFVIKLN